MANRRAASLRPPRASTRSAMRGKSKLSMLYPVMMSGSCSSTNRVMPSSNSDSSSRQVWTLRSPVARSSTTAAAQRIRLSAMLVSRSKESIRTDGKGLGRLKVLDHAMQGEVHAIHATTASGTHR